MNEDLIQLPDLKDVKEMLAAARKDIDTEVKQDPELLTSSKLLTQVMQVIEEKLGKEKNFNKLGIKEKIDIAAHLNFLHCLLEDFFLVGDEEFDESEDFDDLEDLNDASFEEEEE